MRPESNYFVLFTRRTSPNWSMTFVTEVAPECLGAVVLTVTVMIVVTARLGAVAVALYIPH